MIVVELRIVSPRKEFIGTFRGVLTDSSQLFICQYDK